MTHTLKCPLFQTRNRLLALVKHFSDFGIRIAKLKKMKILFHLKNPFGHDSLLISVRQAYLAMSIVVLVVALVYQKAEEPLSMERTPVVKVMIHVGQILATMILVVITNFSFVSKGKHQQLL